MSFCSAIATGTLLGCIRERPCLSRVPRFRPRLNGRFAEAASILSRSSHEVAPGATGLLSYACDPCPCLLWPALRTPSGTNSKIRRKRRNVKTSNRVHASFHHGKEQRMADESQITDGSLIAAEKVNGTDVSLPITNNARSTIRRGKGRPDAKRRVSSKGTMPISPGG
jgi:hypothetical protein